MTHIINLKNRRASEPKLQNSRERIIEHEARVFSWSEQPHYPKNTRIIILVSVLFFTIAALLQFFEKNLITTIFFVLLGIVILLNAGKKGYGKFEIDPVGIKINGNLLKYSGLKSFWIEYDPALGIKELSLQTKKWHMPYIKIPITEQNPVQLRFVLLEFLPEVEHKDTLVEILARKLGL